MKISDNGITKYISNGLGNVIAEIDGVGLLQNKYVYGNGQKLVKLKRNNVVPVGSPFENNLEVATNMSNAHGASFSIVDDRMEGSKSVKSTITYDASFNFANFNFNMTSQYNADSYPYIHVWVKPLDNTDWIRFYVEDMTAGGSLYDWLQGDMDGDGKFEVGTDLVAGKWNELWLDLGNVIHQGHTDSGAGRQVKTFHVHTNAPLSSSDPDVEFLWDHVYVTDEPYTVNYFHNDYLGSVRVITDDAGTVVWSRDYYPFGEERSVTGTGNDYTYEGHEKDTEIDLWNNQARFFNDDGRFTAVDPLWTKYPSLSPYVRVANNPLKYVDPFGLDKVYYGVNGNHLETIEDDDISEVYVRGDQFENGEYLLGTEDEFNQFVATVYSESSGDITESAAIANVINNRSQHSGRSISDIIENTRIYGYNNNDYNRVFGSTSNAESRLVGSRAGVINSLRGGPDYSGGAYFWEGTGFLRSGYFVKGLNANPAVWNIIMTLGGNRGTTFMKYNPTHPQYGNNVWP